METFQLLVLSNCRFQLHVSHFTYMEWLDYCLLMKGTLSWKTRSYVADNDMLVTILTCQRLKSFARIIMSSDLFGHLVFRLVCNYFCECWSYLIPSIRSWFRFWPFEISYSESKMSNKKYFRFSESDLIKIVFLYVRTFSPKNCMSHL